ncbi:MAG: redoxin domain-containing protein [Herpetosiphonaceae bacterium]|nr:redoxin domain-containing protein [Herpetosiphonaceae bacterium]
MSQLAHEYQRFLEAGVALLMVSVDSIRRATELARTAFAPFPVLADRDADATVAFNVFENGIALPSTFVIDKAGTLRWSYIGQNPKDRPTIATMLDQARIVAGPSAAA